jgi:hypothetical protein
MKMRHRNRRDFKGGNYLKIPETSHISELFYMYNVLIQQKNYLDTSFDNQMGEINTKWPEIPNPIFLHP